MRSGSHRLFPLLNKQMMMMKLLNFGCWYTIKLARGLTEPRFVCRSQIKRSCCIDFNLFCTERGWKRINSLLVGRSAVVLSSFHIIPGGTDPRWMTPSEHNKGMKVKRNPVCHMYPNRQLVCWFNLINNYMCVWLLACFVEPWCLAHKC